MKNDLAASGGNCAGFWGDLSPQQMAMILGLSYLNAGRCAVSFPHFRAFLYGGNWAGRRQKHLEQLIEWGFVKSSSVGRTRQLMLTSQAVKYLDNLIPFEVKNEN